MRFDVDKLLDHIDTLEIAEHLGMTICRNGATTYVECVSGEHRESKYNHNQLKRDGCHCYSCGCSYGKIDMVRKYYENILGTPISFSKACMIIGDMCGGYRKFLIKGGKNKASEDFPLTKEQISAIGLATKPQPLYNRGIESYSDEKKEGYTPFKDGYVVFKRMPNNSLQNLWEGDKALFKELIRSKARETMENCQSLIDDLASGPVSEIGAYLILDTQKQYNIARDIYIAFGGLTKKSSQ